MTDNPEIEAPEPPVSASVEAESDETATPEERLAETQPDDPEVGIDGTGMGELP